MKYKEWKRLFPDHIIVIRKKGVKKKSPKLKAYGHDAKVIKKVCKKAVYNRKKKSVSISDWEKLSKILKKQALEYKIVNERHVLKEWPKDRKPREPEEPEKKLLREMEKLLEKAEKEKKKESEKKKKRKKAKSKNEEAKKENPGVQIFIVNDGQVRTFDGNSTGCVPKTSAAMGEKQESLPCEERMPETRMADPWSFLGKDCGEVSDSIEDESDLYNCGDCVRIGDGTCVRMDPHDFDRICSEFMKKADRMTEDIRRWKDILEKKNGTGALSSKYQNRI